MKAPSRTPYSLWALFIGIIFLICGKPLMTEWSSQLYSDRLSWDVFGYYLYLPATFIYGDPLITDMSWLTSLFETYSPSSTLYQIWTVEPGTHLIKYSMGMALLYLPGFLLGHLGAALTGYPMDGMSLPYQMGVTFWSYGFVIWGLNLTRKILLKYFSESWTAWGILLLFACTNFFQISTNAPLSPHTYQFTLYAWFLWSVIQWYEKGERKYLTAIAISLGLALLARPSAIVLLLILASWGCTSWKDVVNNLKQWFGPNKKNALWVAGLTFVIGLPQMVYWFFTTGQPVFYSYPNDGFDFGTPYTLEVLFSYRKGWWVYTPFMALGFLGLWFTWKKNKKLGFPLAIFWFANLYLVSSWNAWWYGGSFGHRAFVDAYGIYLIPILFFLQWVFSKNVLAKASTVAVLLFFSWLNVFQSWQINRGILSDTNMTKAYYWAIFGKSEIGPEERQYMGFARHPKAKLDRSRPYDVAMDTAITPQTVPVKEWGSDAYLIVSPMREVSLEEHTWWLSELSFSVYPKSEGEPKLLFVNQTKHDDKSTRIKDYPVELTPNPGDTLSLSAEYFTPILKAPRDYTRIFFRGHNIDSVVIHNYHLTVLEPTWY